MDTGEPSKEQMVKEITKMHKSLPKKPTAEEVGEAKALLHRVEKDGRSEIERIKRQTNAASAPQDLFALCREMQERLVQFQIWEQTREAANLVELHNALQWFNQIMMRIFDCAYSSSGFATAEPFSAASMSTKDDISLRKLKQATPWDSAGQSSKTQMPDVFSLLQYGSTSGQYDGKLSSVMLGRLIEDSCNNGTPDLMLKNKLMDQIEGLPDSIGNLSSLISCDLSKNHLAVLPKTIGGLSSLITLDLNSNRIVELPDSFGDLRTLVYLDLKGNRLTSLPLRFARLGCLEELDLSSNMITVFPLPIGSLTRLKKLNVETNNMDELDAAIGQCSSLVELCANYNRLKALPEAVGNLAALQILSVRYNKIKQLPSTMSNLSSLMEFDVSFNELESVSENLCHANTLVKMNLSGNFACLRILPSSIGDLGLLEELDISNNQIKVLPDSFKNLSRLRVLRAEENPLELPPRNIAETGAQAVVEYMGGLTEKRVERQQPTQRRKALAHLCFIPKSDKRQHRQE